MSLIAILLGLVVERYLGALHELRNFAWLTHFSQWVRSHAKEGLPGYIATLTPIVLAPMILFWLLPGWLDFALGLLLLIYCVGPANLTDQARAFIGAVERNDTEAAVWYAQQMATGQPLPNQPEQLCHHVTQTLLIQQNDRLLAVIFWFIVLGPVGAILYRCASQLRLQTRDDGTEFASLARQFHHFLAWLPARLTALSYALSGSLTDTINNWRNVASAGNPLWSDTNDRLLAHTGMGALMLRDSVINGDDCTSQTEQALALINRALIIWVCVIAVMTIAGLSG